MIFNEGGGIHKSVYLTSLIFNLLSGDFVMARSRKLSYNAEVEVVADELV